MATKDSTMTTYTTTLRLTTAQARKIRGLAHGEGLSMAQWLRRAVAEKLQRDEHDRAALAAHAQMNGEAK